MVSDEARDAQERGWRQFDEIDDAYRNGSLDLDGWHQAVRSIVEPVYLAAKTPEGGSGHHGSPREWDRTRSIVMSAVSGSGTFLDVGCANGLLMDSVHRWGIAMGVQIEPYGVEISSRIADLARARYPQWADRMWSANAATWFPPRRFDYVRTGTGYVPDDQRRHYLQHLLDHVVASGGRLIVGKLNELLADQPMVQWARQAGFAVAGEVRRPANHPKVEHTVFWIDARPAGRDR